MLDLNRATGLAARASGAGITYTFSADGRYQEIGYLQTSSYGCTTTVHTSEQGTFQVSGNTVVVEISGGTRNSKDTCNARFTYEKPMPARRTSSTWRIERDSSGVRLCLATAGAGETCAHKK